MTARKRKKPAAALTAYGCQVILNYWTKLLVNALRQPTALGNLSYTAKPGPRHSRVKVRQRPNVNITHIKHTAPKWAVMPAWMAELMKPPTKSKRKKARR